MKALFLFGVLLLPDASAPARSFDPANLGLVRTIAPLAGDMYAAAFSPDGRTLAVGCTNEIRLYDTRTWREQKRLAGHPNLVSSIVYSADGKTVAAGGFQGSVMLWDVATGELRKSLPGHPSPVMGVAFSADGKRLACGFGDAVRVFEVPEGKEIKSFDVPNVPALAFSPDGSRLAAACHDSTVKVWDTRRWELERQVASDGVGSSGGFFRDGRRFWVSSEQALMVVHADTGQREKSYPLTAGTSQVRLSSDGRYAIAASTDTGVRVMDLGRRGDEVAKLSHHTGGVSSVAVDPSGRLVATVGQDRHVKVWGYVPGGMARVRPKGFCGIRVQQNANGEVVVAEVIAGTAAAAAGLQAGDVLRKVGGAAIRNTTESIDKISSYMEGDEVEMEIDRSGETKLYKIKLGKRPQNLEN